MMLLRSLRAKGHEASLDGMAVVLDLAPGSDSEVAKTWALKHEQELRRELVSECQHIARVQGVFPDAKLRAVKGPDGAPIVGQVLVRVRVEESA